jgi:molybdenum cofactor guanylyltransferase
MLSNMTSTGQARAGFLLSGGKSSRMGVNADKAFLDFRGQTLLDRALAVMESVCGSLAIVGDPAKLANYAPAKNRTVVADIFPGCGPLAGIHAALAQSPSDLNLMLAVDMPFVSREFLTFLFATAENTATVVTVPRAGKGLQPLCAIYRRAFLAVAEEALRAGKYKIDAAFSQVSIRVIAEDELAAAGFPEQIFFNVNTPRDRQFAEEHLDRP